MNNSIGVSQFRSKRLSLIAFLFLFTCPVFAQQPIQPNPQNASPSVCANNRRLLSANVPVPASTQRINGQEFGESLLVAPGCRVYEIVDGECFQQCIEESGATAKKSCRQACKIQIVECDTFPPFQS